MIYDCFQFFNELDLLRLRIHSLNPIIDKFVISESTVTFSGDPKRLYFDENKTLFRDFQDKIIHNVVRDTPAGNPFERDSFQKCAVARGLAQCVDSDVVIFGDVDEIPNPKKINEILRTFQREKIYHLAQRMFYFYLNLEETSGHLLSFTGEFEGIERKRWLGTKVCSYGLLKKYTLEQLRFPERKKEGIRVDDGGWHFSYMGGDRGSDVAQRVAVKIKSAAHQEFNTPAVLSRLAANIAKRKDIFGRDANFQRVEIDASFPDYLLSHLEGFEHLILHERPRSWLYVCLSANLKKGSS
jgi:beta-1,4-mannosyl-glycoprotein beta-1,4-N-acetylglucosaminyltransferase